MRSSVEGAFSFGGVGPKQGMPSRLPPTKNALGDPSFRDAGTAQHHAMIEACLRGCCPQFHGSGITTPRRFSIPSLRETGLKAASNWDLVRSLMTGPNPSGNVLWICAQLLPYSATPGVVARWALRNEAASSVRRICAGCNTRDRQRDWFWSPLCELMGCTEASVEDSTDANFFAGIDWREVDAELIQACSSGRL